MKFFNELKLSLFKLNLSTQNINKIKNFLAAPRKSIVMASDKEDFVYFLTGDEEFGAPPLLKPNFNISSDSESETNDIKPSEEPASAVNPETGEINWDCPCLKSALEPPCGHTFKAAFACFVGSKTEPKGIDCHELFKAMQECFQAHPEKYGSILSDDEEASDEAQTRITVESSESSQVPVNLDDKETKLY